MNSVKYKLSELFVLFIVFPVVLAIDFPIWIKFILGASGFAYIIFILIKLENTKIKIEPTINWQSFWRITIFKFLLIALITVIYVLLTDKDQLFIVVKNKPLLWLIILIVYTILSVYPQEILYRTFFFKRYQSLINNQNLFIFINAIIFSLGHIFFKNVLVILLTFLGGLLFAYTYNRTKSTILVSIEHAIYGCWLFTVGMGSMLGFPS